MKNSTEVICFKAFINKITFFQDFVRNTLKKSKMISKIGNPNKITSTFASHSKVGLTSTTITLISTKLALTVVPKTAVVGTVFKLLQSQLLEIQLASQKQNLSIFTVQELQEVYQKSFEDNVTDQTEST